MKSMIVVDNINCEKAYEYGLALHDYLKEKNEKKFCIQIRVYGKTVYQYASDECIIDNENWLMRKSNASLYFGASTYDLWIKNNQSDDNISIKYGLKNSLYTFTPGCVPIKLRDGGIVGAVAVSGMAAIEDHQNIIECFRKLKVEVEI